jgi:hypothetical protein
MNQNRTPHPSEGERENQIQSESRLEHCAELGSWVVAPQSFSVRLLQLFLPLMRQPAAPFIGGNCLRAQNIPEKNFVRNKSHGQFLLLSSYRFKRNTDLGKTTVVAY